MNKAELQKKWRQNAQAFRKQSLRDKYMAPSYFFARKTGMQGVHTAWKMPDGKTPRQMEREIWRAFKAAKPQSSADLLPIANDFFDRILALNPQLQGLQIDRTRLEFHLQAALFGATSQFCYQDIYDFVHVGTGVVDRGADYRALRQKIDDYSGCPIYWIPSRVTLEQIAAQIWPKIPRAPDPKDPTFLARYL